MGPTLAEGLNLRSPGTAARIATISVLFLITYLPVLATLHAKYSEIDSYYSHGYLVPLVSGFIIWHKRDRLKPLRGVPSPSGLWVLGGGLLVYLLATWWYVNFAAALSMLIVLGGLSLSLAGRAVTRELAFPLAFLLFMIPLPKISIIYITFWLKLFVASVAVQLVDAVGVPVLLEGAFITLPNGVLEVDNACSGLRSLIALTALGVVYAYLQPVSPMRKWIIVLSAIPIAIAANLTRVVALVGVSYLSGPTGPAFERADFTTGLLVFVVALIGLYAVARAVRAWEGRRGGVHRLGDELPGGHPGLKPRGGREVADLAPAPVGSVAAHHGMRRYSAVIGMLVASAVLASVVAGSQGGKYDIRLREFPVAIGSWRGQDVELKRADLVYAVLETSAVLSRIYERSGTRDERVDLLVTYFERGHRGFHPPEVSFVAQGNTIVRSGTVGIPLAEGPDPPLLEANMFVGKTPAGEVVFLYWFGIGDRWMASYSKGSVYLLWNAILRRPSPASMVRIALPVANGDLERTMAIAMEFIRQVVPILPDYLAERPRAGGAMR